MRVTFVLPFAGLAGGIRVVSIYARALHERGHEVTSVSVSHPPPDLRSRVRDFFRLRGWGGGVAGETGHFDNVPFDHKVLPHPGPVAAADVPDADVVVATWWETAHWVNALPPSKGRKAHFIQHDETHFDLRNEALRAGVVQTWSLPTYKIAVAQWLADIAEAQYDAPGVAVVPNGVDLEQFHAPPRGRNRVPAVGLIYAHSLFKGVDIMAEAVRLARREVPRLRLTSFGAGEPGPDDLPRPYEFLQAPPQHKLRDQYAACDAWLVGSRSEGFGLPILEAMACRTPVITTPVGAAPELLAGGGGVMVKPQDPMDMAHAIVRLATADDAAWRALSDRALATARRHTWDASIDAFEHHLHRAAEGEVQGAEPAGRPAPIREAAPARAAG